MARAHVNRKEPVLRRMIGHINDLVLTDAEGSICEPMVAAGSRLTLTAQIRALCDVQKPHFGLMITAQEDAIVAAASNTMLGEPDVPQRAGEELTVGFTIDLPLARGDYLIDFGLAEAAGESLDVLEWRRGVSHLVVTNSGNATGIVDTRAVYRRS
ncbi:MAG: Wzt carbohydrate-binding domain-containing protein [Blastomonas fulva]|uniref:Wzt carbohydrate-binding domain-containing protein n=1 Tax=Blastomonas fulva TaxID=1550728 RepID=UPI0040341AB9